MNPVIIAAAKFEIDPLIQSLQARGWQPIPKVIGVGSLNAAKAAPALAVACKGKDVIFVGTCGTFGTFDRIRLVSISQVIWLPVGVRTGVAYTVENTAPAIDLPSSPRWCESLKKTTAICSPAIGLIKSLPDNFEAPQCVENLELYSVAKEISCAASLAVVLAITNEVGAEAHAGWRQNFKEASGLVAEFISHKA